MEAKHTPGPWAVNGGEDVWVGKRACIYVGDESDARLIAAAPELLEACKAALEYDKAIRLCGNNPERMSSFCTASGEDLDTLYFSWVNKSRSATAKALGHHRTPRPDEAMAGEQEID